MDHRALSRRPQQRDRRAAEQEGAGQRPGDDLVPFGQRHRLDRLWLVGEADEVDQRVETRTARRDRVEGSRDLRLVRRVARNRSEEHTSELQSLMRISYAVFCLKKKTNEQTTTLT